MRRLANPFRYLAGSKALLLGLVFLLATALLLHAASMVQDSLLHFAVVPGLSFGQVLAAQLLLWLLQALLLYAVGRLLSRSKIRPIDLLGTTAFAQLPLLPINLPLLVPACSDLLLHRLSERILQGGVPAPFEVAALLLYALYAIALLILYYVWNYQALAVSCNLHGSKAIAAYIGVMLLAMLLSPMAVRAIL